jgi:LytS/YehU family sensor histidine kinase
MILSYCEENFITLDKEIDMLQLYLELEQLRLSNEFSFKIDVEEDLEAEEIPIPPMMLQPFVENAIWHGLLSKEGEKTLHVHFKIIDQDTLLCVVDDNGIGRIAAQKIKEEKKLDRTINRSKGMSLVYNRLEILEKKYNRQFSVDIEDKHDASGFPAGTRVDVTIPIVD